jgi:hypothetical protein
MILTTILILPCIESDNTQNIQYIKNFQINSSGIFFKKGAGNYHIKLSELERYKFFTFYLFALVI